MTEAERAFRDDLAPMKVTLVKQKHRIIGVSPVFDYIYRPIEMEQMSLYEWVHRCSRKKLPKGKKLKAMKKDECNAATLLDSADISFDSALGDLSDSPDSGTKDETGKIYCFGADHPLHATHGLQKHKADSKKIPNFIGATLPRKDRGDRNYYCLTMLALFKPWRKGTDLKPDTSVTWHETFEQYTFSEEQNTLIQNFHIKYECLDSRDDYRAQMVKGGPGAFISSWDDDDGDHDDLAEPIAIPDGTEFDLENLPSFLQEGTAYRKRKEQRLMMRRILASVGWTTENKKCKANITESIKPLKSRSAAEWKLETARYRQSLLDLRKDTNDTITYAKTAEASNIVKVVDKSYLQKSYNAGQGHVFIEEAIKKFSLNREQERAFRIIANYASNLHSGHLKMYIGGMGGTGKTQVLKALTHFFELRKEMNRFVIVAPTGTAASLLGGSTYHYMFGINEHSGTLSNFAKVRSRLAGVDYVFFDEVSMLSARDLYRISYQLAHTFNKPELPFGGMNMVFCGDFAQLPPVPGG